MSSRGAGGAGGAGAGAAGGGGGGGAGAAGGAGGAMSTEQLIQQVALLQWLVSQSDADRSRLAALTGLQVGRELFHRLTGRKQLDAYKAECILTVAEFLQQNPQASQAQIAAEVQRNVVLFAARVRALETQPLF